MSRGPKPVGATTGPAGDSCRAAGKGAGAGSARGSDDRGKGGGVAQSGQGAEWSKTGGKAYREQSASWKRGWSSGGPGWAPLDQGGGDSRQPLAPPRKRARK